MSLRARTVELATLELVLVPVVLPVVIVVVRTVCVRVCVWIHVCVCHSFYKHVCIPVTRYHGDFLCIFTPLSVCAVSVRDLSLNTQF